MVFVSVTLPLCAARSNERFNLTHPLGVSRLPGAFGGPEADAARDGTGWFWRASRRWSRSGRWRSSTLLSRRKSDETFDLVDPRSGYRGETDASARAYGEPIAGCLAGRMVVHVGWHVVMVS